MKGELNFMLEKQSSGSRARAAKFTTLHGDVQTPIFMPVGTQATVKGQTVESLTAAGARVLLVNTYHLLLRPGMDVLKSFGGIHNFMNWHGPVLSDSGGYQIFSLPHSREINEEGARFQSYVDGQSHLLSPELSIEMQKAIGSDIMMALDVCIPATAPYAQARSAMEITHGWAQRSLRARGDSRQALFGIVQGACHADLRRISAEFSSGLAVDGLAIGGLAVGESHHERYDVTELVAAYLPENLPRYLMGVGAPNDILESVHRGVDMFDCIIPSQLARRGVAFTSHGKLQLRRSVHKFSQEPLDTRCDCRSCRQHSRGYIHHLIKCDELLGWHLLGIHNLTFYQRLMSEMRQSILADEFLAYYETKRSELTRSDEDNPVRRPRSAKASQSTRMGDYEIRTFAEGFSSIRQISSGEIMHSVNAPDAEAHRLYVEQSCLAARLMKQESDINELVIWDVGLGAAFNAMAVIHCFETSLGKQGAQALRRLRLVSFEWDFDPLRLALTNPSRFPHLRHGAPRRVLQSAKWKHTSDLLEWELLEGNFADVMESAKAPKLIFYDPFSYKTNAALWTVETFSRIFDHCRGEPAELYTYSAATAVRVALLAAGFFVAQGIGTGPKSDTTIAFTTVSGSKDHPLSPRLLGPSWLTRWRRSDAKFATTVRDEDKAAFEKLIESHRQFT